MFARVILIDWMLYSVLLLVSVMLFCVWFDTVPLTTSGSNAILAQKDDDSLHVHASDAMIVSCKRARRM